MSCAGFVLSFLPTQPLRDNASKCIDDPFQTKLNCLRQDRKTLSWYQKNVYAGNVLHISFRQIGLLAELKEAVTHVLPTGTETTPNSRTFWQTV